ncbi:hypothetical protein O7623_26035 [Solwaraspora sp. WMMD791]|uniref:hypothetical protein n=1 Tax=Solwaraspora sp. WMMD791 TaxID=3016086 RepID=UPI00249AB0A9|nr:hypothetical protein [Solwaraspora sp. WMMD791]WFE26707.1 hypothetical protein O7623_26035 [Solwaraspora sp. WMMD791]
MSWRSRLRPPPWSGRSSGSWWPPQRRAEELEISALRADLLRRAGSGGWVETDPPPELTWRGFGTVIPDEKRRCALVGTHDGRQVALIWCSYEDNDWALRGWSDRPVRIEGRALRVVVDGWPRLADLGVHLTAATTLAAALSVPRPTVRRPPDPDPAFVAPRCG